MSDGEPSAISPTYRARVALKGIELNRFGGKVYLNEIQSLSVPFTLSIRTLKICNSNQDKPV
jgi:hypothetical protein